MAGAVANKCSANLKAISYLQMQGIPVLYDLKHFQDTLQRGRYIDQIFCRLYVDPTISGDNMQKILKMSRSIVREDVPIELKQRYEDELLSIECFLGRIFKSFPGKKLRMSHINSNLFESVGAELAQSIHPDGEEAFEKFKELHDPHKAVTFMATLAAVRSQIIHSKLRKLQNTFTKFVLKDDEELPGPSKRPKLQT
ncbi:uncharacterized protein LOC116654779 [Drosophila ananassae]|uniref:uncharacterized protein LOC116654779 n=1 Tax=Drosophila ananassae TaxID=7217 RepID=UPI0013A5D98D|nr:uncharacterized protein LOC116654779 [Drosophila ananassae]